MFQVKIETFRRDWKITIFTKDKVTKDEKEINVEQRNRYRNQEKDRITQFTKRVNKNWKQT